MSRHKGPDRYPVARQGAPRVEAEPAEPEYSHAYDRKCQVMRGHELSRPAPSPADVYGRHKRGDARAYVHHYAASEVQDSEPLQPAAAPDPVAKGVVDEEGPEDAEDDDR